HQGQSWSETEGPSSPGPAATPRIRNAAVSRRTLMVGSLVSLLYGIRRNSRFRLNLSWRGPFEGSVAPKPGRVARSALSGGQAMTEQEEDPRDHQEEVVVQQSGGILSNTPWWLVSAGIHAVLI